MANPYYVQNQPGATAPPPPPIGFQTGGADPGYPPVQYERNEYPAVQRQPAGSDKSSSAEIAHQSGAPPGCPPGLEYLTMVDQLLVKQKVELLEAFTGFETQNQYDVLNSMGQKIYHAEEDACCCCCGCCYVCCKCCVRCWARCQKKTMCCCKERNFTISVFDNSRHKVITVDRPLRCSSCWYPCCLQKVTVSAPPGHVVGYVKQKWSLCRPYFSIQDDRGDTVLYIEGPCITYSCCCGDVEFKVLSKDGSTQVGKVSKQWSGFAKEKFTDADNFGITFPQDLDVKIKATILGACFLIDFMYFEDSPGSNKDKPGMMD